MSKIGLVLSGGMAKGAYQIGALQAINEVFKPSDFSFVSSASVGALNSYAYLTNNLKKGVEMWKNLNSGCSSRRLSSLLRNSFLQESIKSIVSKDKINCPFYIPLVNLKKRKLSYVNIGKVRAENIEPYLLASVALPLFNSGVKIKNDRFYDGAMIDNVPILPLLKHKVDYVICVYFDKYDHTFESDNLDNKVIKINFVDNTVIKNFIGFKDESIKNMMADGYARAKRMLDYVLVNGKDDIGQIHSRISDLNAMNADRKMLRITEDIVVDNMNKITKKFMNKTEILS
jgi:Predicted esterase of the alpha-beta hydrolase superfamily